MPSVLPPSTVVVTGASGFNGAWICKALLEAGYNVRGTVRSQEKGDFLRELFKTHGSSFTPVIVGDISKPDAFDNVIDGAVSAVIHVAGVVHMAPSSTSEVFGPNVDSVAGLIGAVLKNGKQVKRLIYMSSAQAMLGKPLTHVYTEDDWNDGAVQAVQEKGREADGLTIYAASKVHAERALIKFAEEHKDIAWDITRIVPGFIYGPIIHQCSSFDQLNLTTKLFVQHLLTPKEKTNVNDYCTEYIDVRDVASAFVAALQIEEAGGERLILDAGACTFQNLFDAFHSVAPEEKLVPFGEPGQTFAFPGPFCNPAKAQKILKLNEFRGLAECSYDTFKSLKEKSLLPA